MLSLIATDVGVPSRRMLVDIVIGLQQALGFFGCSIELHPLLVRRLRDTVCRDASGLDPIADCVDGLLRRREDLDDLLGRVPLSEAR